MRTRGPQLTALLIAPDHDLAQQFLMAAEQGRVFQVTGEIKTYPVAQSLEMRLRQAKPQIVFVDVASDLDVSCEVIRACCGVDPQLQIIGIHRENNADAILRSLRAGAAEFIPAPFEITTQTDAAERLRRMLQPDEVCEHEPGSLNVFSSAKPGSGSSTLAAQTAFALKRATQKRVLLADFDVMGGMIGFYLKLNHGRSVLDALQAADQLNDGIWSTLIASHDGVDVLSAPDTPFAANLDSARLHAVFEFARQNYDWIIVDVPVVFQRLSLMAISEADQAFLITTSELPSLHLARKAVNLLNQLGFPRDRFQILMNRINKRDEIAVSDIEKLFNCAVHSRFPNDYFSLHRAVTLGQAVDAHSELGKAIEALAGKLTAPQTAGSTKKSGVAEGKAQLSYA